MTEKKSISFVTGLGTPAEGEALIHHSFASAKRQPEMHCQWALALVVEETSEWLDFKLLGAIISNGTIWE
jgi:hypothetical protein